MTAFFFCLSTVPPAMIWLVGVLTVIDTKSQNDSLFSFFSALCSLPLPGCQMPRKY